MKEPLTFTLSRLATSIGTMLLATDAEGRLRVLDWETHAERMRRLLQSQYGPKGVRLVEGPTPPALAEKLIAFLAGHVAAIEDIAIATAGTPFQREVWAALRQIPAGETWTYSRLAAHIGRPKAVRAVGAANGANPIGVVVPCHRVIGKNGALTGYGGGTERKAWLLGHERAWSGGAAR